MKVKIGDMVESEFGMGKLVAVTKDWIIHEIPGGGEVALYRGENAIWVPAEFELSSSPLIEVDLPAED